MFYDVSKINVDVHTCYLTEKYHHKNRDTLKYNKKGGYQLINVDKDMDILVYIYICIDFHTACEHSLLRRKFIVIETKSITERVSGSEKPVYGPSGLHNG